MEGLLGREAPIGDMRVRDMEDGEFGEPMEDVGG